MKKLLVPRSSNADFSRLVPRVFLAGLFLILAGSAPSRAQEFAASVVTSDLDVVDPGDGLVTLREAIADAKPGDTIVFDAGLAGATIRLDGVPLTLDKAIAIDATALFDEQGTAPGVTIDAGGRSRVFSVVAGTPWAPVAIKGLAIVHGKVARTGAARANGGGIENRGTLNVEKCAILNNVADCGAGLYNNSSSALNVVDCRIANNATEGEISSGGGVYNDNSGRLSATNCEIVDNTAEYGGGICNTRNLTMKNCTVARNLAKKSGGGIYAVGGSLSASNSAIVENASRNKGDGIFVSAGKLNLTNCTIAGNRNKSRTDGAGTGLYQYQGMINARNCVVALNDATPQKNDVVVMNPRTIRGSNNLSTCDAWLGDDNLEYDAERPLFASAEGGDYRLASFSQAIDQGANEFVATTVDLAGAPRICREIVDLGAYEFASPTVGALWLKSYRRKTRRAVVEWDAIRRANEYLLNVSEDGGKTWREVGAPDVLRYKNVDALYPGNSYAFRVSANDADDAALEDYAEGTIEPIKLADSDAPYIVGEARNVVLQAATPANVELRWYELTDDGRRELEELRGQPSYSAPNGDYELIVVAIGKEETPSAGFESEIAIARPTHPIVFANPNAAGTSVDASWSAIPGAASYKIRISRDGGKKWIDKGKPLDVTSRRLTGIADGNMFRVYAYDANGVRLKSIAEGTFTTTSEAATAEDFVDFFAEDFAEF